MRSEIVKTIDQKARKRKKTEILSRMIFNSASATIKKQFVSVVMNLTPSISYEEMEGRSYMVVPMVMLTVGVHNGSQGPLLYTEEELQKVPESWNHKPIIVYHPTQNTTACTKEVLDKQKVGVIMNARWEGRFLV